MAHIRCIRFPRESRENGGAETQVMQLLRGLKSRGHSVDFAGSCTALKKACSSENIPVHEFPKLEPPVTMWDSLALLWRWYSYKAVLKNVLEHEPKPQAIICLGMLEKLIATPMARKRGMRVVWIEHDPVGRWLIKNPWLPLLRRRAKKASVVTVSAMCAAQYRRLKFPAHSVRTIVNAIDPSRIGQLHLRHMQQRNLRIGTVGRLAKEKGIDLLIEAVEQIPGITLDIVGTGPEGPTLLNMVEAKNLTDRIAFHDRVPNIAEFYESLDVFVLPSRTIDPFGLAAAEAMATGIATIVTTECGISELLQSGVHAWIVPAGNAAALEKAIRAFGDSDARSRIAKMGKTLIHASCSPERMVVAYETLLLG